VAASAVELATITAVAPRVLETTSHDAAVAAPSHQVVAETPDVVDLRSRRNSWGTRSATPAPVITTARTAGATAPHTAAAITPATDRMIHLRGHPLRDPITMMMAAASSEDVFATSRAQYSVRRANADHTLNKVTEMVHVAAETPSVFRVASIFSACGHTNATLRLTATTLNSASSACPMPSVSGPTRTIGIHAGP
jgi:hypothetical protein